VAIALGLVAIVELTWGQVFFDGSFETPALPPGGYAEGSAASSRGLSFGGTQPNYDTGGVTSSGILHPDATSGMLPAAFGEQYAVLHSGGTFTIDFWNWGILPPGTYLLTLSVAPQSDGYLDYFISLNPHWKEVFIGSEQDIVEVGWHERQFEFTAPDSVELIYFRSNPNLDYDVFVDGISIVAVPEPGMAALFCAGFAVCWCRFRRNAERPNHSAPGKAGITLS
jgi:hypothetical protein